MSRAWPSKSSESTSQKMKIAGNFFKTTKSAGKVKNDKKVREKSVRRQKNTRGSSSHFYEQAMALFLFLACFLLGGSAAASLVDTVNESYTFDEFAAKFGKTYSDKEGVTRKAVFEENLRLILEHNNKADKSHVLGVNHLMDLEHHEIPRGYDKSFHASWKGASDSDALLHKHQLELPFDIDDVSTLPKAVDWRAHGIVTPVKFQGFCGSCWAFASTTVLESHIALQTGVMYTLAVQELVSCVDNPRSCGGGESKLL